MRDGRFSLKQFPAELREAGLRFCQHRHNAEVRNVEWLFTFDEWWKAWQDSGRWNERGSGTGKYCMCRVGDVGPYAPHNVFIATFNENSASIDRSKTTHNRARHGKLGKTLPVGVRTQKGSYYATKCIRGKSYHIGTFPTPELAHSAYQNFSA